MADLIARAAGFLRRQRHVDLAGGPDSVVFVAGPGRRGTTWVGDLINYKGDHRVVFEPFRSDRRRGCSHLRRRQYVRPGTDNADVRTYVLKVLAGRIRGRYVGPSQARGLP